MEKLTNVVRLMTKTGLFFANCDGQYAQSEKSFIERFIAQMEQVGSVDEELKCDVADATSRKYSFEEVVQDTQTLLDGFNSDERKVILLTIDAFIQKVIKADKRIAEAENIHYESWKKQFDLS